MSDLIVLGTDTGVGKTTFSLLWMAAFGDQYAYWKPVETGDSDTELIRLLLPTTQVHAPAVRYPSAVAPALAARQQGGRVPPAAELAAARPQPSATHERLLIESFGSPLSPLNDDELQIRLIQLLDTPAVLVASSAVGAIGRTRQSLIALALAGIRPVAVVLIGPRDDYAVEQLGFGSHAPPVFALEVPGQFTSEAVAACAAAQRTTLLSIRGRVEPVPTTVAEADALSELIERDQRSVWHPYSLLRETDPPLVVTEAQDEFLTLADGRRIIDGISSWWTILHGHRHPVLMAALSGAAGRLDQVHFAGVTHSSAIELAELMLSTMPWQDGRVFFSDDGSTAVEVALKMAYQYWCHHGEPQRTCFVGFENGYHGDTFGAMSVGRDPVFFGRFEPLLFRAERVSVSAQSLDDFLRRIGDQVSAVIIEPLVQGAGGMRMHSPAELREIHQVARDHGVLFIVDEVMTGGGRTGDLWAHLTAGIAPDLVCAGKTIAGGVLPIAATLVAPHIVAAWETSDRSKIFFHGHSFTAHALACAVGVANWRMLLHQPPHAPTAMEQFWVKSLASLRQKRGIKEIRIRGSIAAVELDSPGGYLADVSRQLRAISLRHGVLLRPLGNVLYAMPPFCTSPRSLAQIVSAIEHAVAAVSDGRPHLPD